MSVFNFVSHESFPQDAYTKEAVVLCFDGKYRITYLRKVMKNGGLFWDVMSVGVADGNGKKYLKSFAQDSNFLAEDVRDYLENRKWENRSCSQAKKPLAQQYGGEAEEAMPF